MEINLVNSNAQKNGRTSRFYGYGRLFTLLDRFVYIENEEIGRIE